MLLLTNVTGLENPKIQTIFFFENIRIFTVDRVSLTILSSITDILTDTFVVGIRPVQKGGVRAFYIQQPPKINETKFARVRGCIFSMGPRLNNSLFPLNKANYLRTEFEPNPDSRLAL